MEVRERSTAEVRGHANRPVSIVTGKGEEQEAVAGGEVPRVKKTISVLLFFSVLL